MLKNRSVQFNQSEPGVDVNRDRLERGGVGTQCFAMYLSESLPHPGMYDLLDMADLFSTRIASDAQTIWIKTSEDLENSRTSGKLGAILTLEGVDGLQGNLGFLRILYNLGLRIVGVTWNYANWAADGIGEPRGGAFTNIGKLFVQECDRLGLIMDVSHLSEEGFWELTELSQHSFVATHSNARRICPHRRNLTDDQIGAIIQMDGRMGLTFVPWFVKEKNAAVKDLLLHIDHIGSLGGAGIIGFGSDFDGFEEKLPGLSDPSDYPFLVNELLKHYRQEDVDNFLYGNWHRFLKQRLPMA